MGSIPFFSRKGSELEQLQNKRYEKTKKLRSCLKCSELFDSLYPGHRICQKHTRNGSSYVSMDDIFIFHTPKGGR